VVVLITIVLLPILAFRAAGSPTGANLFQTAFVLVLVVWCWYNVAFVIAHEISLAGGLVVSRTMFSTTQIPTADVTEVWRGRTAFGYSRLYGPTGSRITTLSSLSGLPALLEAVQAANPAVVVKRTGF
jgi:hypothetical protein